MPDALVVETIDLRKTYDGVEALRGLNIQVPAGSIFGFLGRNGAGKTTAIKVLLGMVRATGGHARVFGLDGNMPRSSLQIRRRTGFVSEDKDLFEYMTVDEVIRFTAAFYPRWRADLTQRYVRSLELPVDRTVKSLSRGMRTNLALVLALCRGAELLVLDEPTSGLDPSMSEAVLQALVAHVAAEGATVFFSSHRIAEVDQISDRIAIIDRGRAVVAGGLDEVRQNYCRVQSVFDRDAPMPPFLTSCVGRTQRSGRVLTIISKAGAERILDELRAFRPVSIDVTPLTLKEIFLESVAEEE